jgi:hypothetical protein
MVPLRSLGNNRGCPRVGQAGCAREGGTYAFQNARDCRLTARVFILLSSVGPSLAASGSRRRARRTPEGDRGRQTSVPSWQRLYSCFWPGQPFAALVFSLCARPPVALCDETVRAATFASHAMISASFASTSLDHGDDNTRLRLHDTASARHASAADGGTPPDARAATVASAPSIAAAAAMSAPWLLSPPAFALRRCDAPLRRGRATAAFSRLGRWRASAWHTAQPGAQTVAFIPTRVQPPPPPQPRASPAVPGHQPLRLLFEGFVIYGGTDVPCGTANPGELEDWGHIPCHFTDCHCHWDLRRSQSLARIPHGPAHNYQCQTAWVGSGVHFLISSSL